MILNIIMTVLLYIFTLYGIFSTNVVYSLWGQFPFTVLLIAYIGTTVLWGYLLYLFISGLYKNTLHKNYGYSYLIFFIIFFIFYFGYYTNFNNILYVSESEFETRLSNIEVKDEDNGLIQLGKLLKYNDGPKSILGDLNDKIGNHYSCLRGKHGKNCEKESLDKSLEIYRLEKDNIETWNKKISKIIEYKYFKIDSTDNERVSIRGLSILLKANLFNTIDELEKGNIDKAINNLLIYSKLGNKLMKSDNELIGGITSIGLSNRSTFNIGYIVDNYDLNIENLNLLKSELDYMYDIDDIFSNIVKVDYWSYYYRVNNMSIRASMILNIEELLNEDRKEKLNIINDDYSDYKKRYTNYFKRDYFYSMFGNPDLNWEGYKKDFELVNIERKEVLEKIKKKIDLK